jgi:hypothetical protein
MLEYSWGMYFLDHINHMIPWVLKGIMRYFKVLWVHGLGLGLRV